MCTRKSDLFRCAATRLLGYALAITTTAIGPAAAQQAAKTAPLVFDGVTIVDVDRGALVPDQRVVVNGTRIAAVGSSRGVVSPAKARVVDAHGKYLMPGLWDMHAHAGGDPTVYARLISRGVTGIREMASSWPDGFDAIRQQRREIATGTLAGPRIVATSYDFYGQVCRPESIYALNKGMSGDSTGPFDPESGCISINGNTVTTPEEVRRWVDTLKAGGVDFVKAHTISNRAIYLAFLAEARRLGIPAAGHAGGYDHAAVTDLEGSDSGLKSLEHIIELYCWQDTAGTSKLALYGRRLAPLPDSIAERQCAPVAERYKRNGTWLVPTLAIHVMSDSAAVVQGMRVLHRVGMPVLIGTDFGPRFDLSVHRELALFVAAGVPSADAIRAATLAPARFFGATDSLGTVAPGKVADLILLDADPLQDIAHTTAIRAVVANGRYFDRAALDALVAESGAKGDAEPNTP